MSSAQLGVVDVESGLVSSHQNPVINFCSKKVDINVP